MREEEVQMSDVWNSIQMVSKKNGGFVTTKQIEDAGINRVYLKDFLANGSIERIGRGYYALPDTFVDEYAWLQSRSSLLVFSHGTALWFWGMSDRVPHIIDVTIPSGTNVSRIKKDNTDVHFHYIKPELYDLGITETKSPAGVDVRLYDRERSICDIVCARKHTDSQLYLQAIKDYFNNQPDLRKLLKYAKKFGIEDEIRTYAEILA